MTGATGPHVSHRPNAVFGEQALEERALTALGPERVLFGTDSGTTAPYRKWIAFQQRRIIEELGLSFRDQDLVLRGNAVRIFKLDE